MASTDYKAILLGQSRSELNITAKKLKIKNYSHGTKEELAESILSSRTTKQIKRVVAPSLWNSYHNHVYGVTSIIGLIIAVWALPKSHQENPRLEELPTVRSTNPSEQTPRPILSPPNSSPTSAPSPKEAGNLPSSPKKQPAPKTELASDHINKARELIGRGPKYYLAALTECNRALRLEPNNQEALELKHSVNALRKLENNNQNLERLLMNTSRMAP